MSSRYPQFSEYEDGAFVYFMGTKALGFFPEVESTQTMRVYYLRKPREFNLANQVRNKESSYNPLDDEDELTIPDEQHQCVFDWVMWRALERLNRRTEAKDHRAQYSFAKREYEQRDHDPQTISTSEYQQGLGFGNKGI